MNTIYDLAIIGGGPAGIAAGVYAARKRLKTVFITKDFEGQSSVSTDVQNWIGTISISGLDLSKNMENHLKAYAADIIDIKKGELAVNVKKLEKGFLITTDKGSTYEARAILITAGSRRRKLEAPGAEEFDNKGLTYCASCDGPLFAGQDVAVIGGGNAAFDTAAQLLAYCKTVTLIHRGTEFKADPITVQKTLENPNFKVIINAEIAEVKGTKFVTSIVTKDTMSGTLTELPITGIFVEIGSLPNTDFVKDTVKLDAWNHIVTDPRTQMTSVPGIWAAGDATDGLYHQNNIAAGDAVKALEDIYLHLHKTK